ncbi:MAG: SMP-30/gluconolactonase/LRE family protein [Rhodocyclaceae bacterium]|nr:SMP-30/gluconolactonase/LRE family protein [Pseudomonadota bacterium]MDQ7971069.1 SMP-30/gluconolactonase/LRE family protein [Rhodocyclaceae bacterium]MDQ7998390.1 SMP-30/gluconolactonase/LRE family protein [Pseudomonadota bacterium]MDQ8015847.1 SMP-30/gluconolactonase/LRE family protein [Pseudomonadota bacterium]
MRIVADNLDFPEGPVMLADGSLLVVEIRSGCLTRVFADGRRSVVAKTGGGPNGAAVGPDGACYVCDGGGFEWHRHGDGTRTPGLQPPDYAGGRIQRVDLRSGRVEVLYTHSDKAPLKGPNDIVFGDDGGFWFSDLGKRRQRDMDHGAICWARPDGSECREVIFPMNTPNGVGLSPDGRRLYVAETAPGRLWAFDVVEPGRIERAPDSLAPHGGTLVAGLPGYQLFDSLAVEADGRICVATLFNGGITVIAPDGSTIEHVPLPDRFTTNLCFGGPDMKTAYVTLSSTGRLAALDWPRPGLRPHFFERDGL